MHVETRRQLWDAMFRRSLVYPVVVFVLTVVVTFSGDVGILQLSPRFRGNTPSRSFS